MYQYQVPKIVWVNGLEGAKAFQIMPNSNAILMDSEAEVFYIKTADNIGMCNIRSFKYKEIIPEKEHYITREELESILNERTIQSVEQTEPHNRISDERSQGKWDDRTTTVLQESKGNGNRPIFNN